ncbi:MAG: hypothetical protein WC548_03935 [Candidatus Pacearchaeota archaeon]
MGTSAVQFKLMPKNIDENLKEIVEKAKKEIERMGGKFSSSEEIPIAFGLKAIMVSLAYPESQDIDLLGNELQKIKGISSVEMTDYRRAIG